MDTPARRSMSAALKTSELSPEAFALIKAGTPKSQVDKALIGQGEEPIAGRVDVPEAGSSARTAAGRLSRRALPPEVVPLGGLAHLSVRLPAELPQALLRASMERKLAREEPWTQQEIVAEALMQWLKKNGFDT